MNMDEKMSRLIFYFTGTGNCLYVARQLADDNTELLSIPQLMKQKELNFEADEIGLVYPIYGHMPPYIPEFGISNSHFSCYARFPIGAYYICPPNNMDGKM